MTETDPPSPSATEIAERAAQVRAGWSPDERAKRVAAPQRCDRFDHSPERLKLPIYAHRNRGSCPKCCRDVLDDGAEA